MFIGNYTNKLMDSIESVYSEPLLWIALFIYLGIATYTDVKKRKIPNLLNGIFIGVRLALIPFVGFTLLDGVGAVAGLLLLLIPAMILMQPMGGDIKAAFVLGLYLGLYFVPVFIFISSIFLVGTIFVSFEVQKRKGTSNGVIFLPFAPFFLVTHTLLFIYSFFM